MTTVFFCAGCVGCVECEVATLVGTFAVVGVRAYGRGDRPGAAVKSLESCGCDDGTGLLGHSGVSPDAGSGAEAEVEAGGKDVGRPDLESAASMAFVSGLAMETLLYC